MASFEELPKAVQDVSRSYEEANGNGERPTFKFAPSEQLGITSPTKGNVYPDAPAPAAPDTGALSQVVPQQAAQQPAPQQSGGALSQSMTGLTVPKMISPQDALAQYLPASLLNDERGQNLAMAAGFGSVTKTGQFGETLGNVASAVQQQRMQQEQLRMQYLPHIMQQVAQQQQLEFQRQLTNKGIDMFNAAMGGQSSSAPNVPNVSSPAQGQSVTGLPASGVSSSPSQVQGTSPNQSPTGNPIQTGTTPTPTGSTSPANPPGLLPALAMSIIPGMGPASQIFAKQAELNDYQKQVIASGKPYGSPAFIAAMNDKNLKDSRLQPTSLRPGAPYIGSDNKIHTTPASPPPGHMNVVDANDNWSVVPVTGGLGAVEAGAQASAMGAAGAHPTTVYSGTTPVQSTAALQSKQAQGLPLPAGAPSATVPVTPVLPPGVESGATGTQKQMVDKFGELTAQAAQAQTQNSYLTGIADQAKQAIVGPASDKLNYANNLLAQISLPASTDMATAYGVMKKNESQIIARMRTGGLGTDQAQTLLQAAYPNSGMTIDAINKTSANLIGANNMTLAKNQVLAPHANALSPVTYSQNESIFNKNADPTLFERYAKYKDLTPGTPAAQAYLSGVLKQDPTFLDRVKTLTKIGAF